MVARSQLVRLSQVSELTGLPRYSLVRRIQAHGIETFKDPIDLRVRSINAKDISRLTEAVPTRRDLGEPVSAA